MGGETVRSQSCFRLPPSPQGIGRRDEERDPLIELFDINSYTLSAKGKQYLDKFIPIYINTIFSNQNLSKKIANVVIQGHTDSQMFKNVPSKELQFTKNMDLSLKRANAVEEYIFKTNYNKKYTDKLTHKIMVEGKSYTDPILINGKEDYAKADV